MLLLFACAAKAGTEIFPYSLQFAPVAPQAGSYYTSTVNVAVDDNYIPNVLWHENPDASPEALEAYAIAARSYLYWTFSQETEGGHATSIKDGSADQLYSLSGAAPFTRATATAAQLKYLAAADQTEREILITPDMGFPIAGFHVTGGTPDTSANAATIWPAGAELGRWENGDLDPTGTESLVTYNRGLSGSAVQRSARGSTTNSLNHGALSRNGANFLAAGRTNQPNPARNFAGWDYVDILKYYFGQDAQLAMAQTNTNQPAFTKEFISFEHGEGYLRNRMNFSSTNSANILYASSSHSLDTTTAQSGTTSQKIVLDIAAGAPQAFTYRHMSGMVMGTAADPALNDNLIGTDRANLMMEDRGSMGFWIKTTSPNLTARPLLNNFGITQGSERRITADGQWHKYEWFLKDTPEWSMFQSTSSVNIPWTLNSILFTGSGDSTLNIDNVFYNAAATLPPNEWITEGGGSYHQAGNWISAPPNARAATARFVNSATGHRTITISSPVTMGTLQLSNPNGYDLVADSSTAAINIENNQTTTFGLIDVQSSGMHSISVPMNIKSYSYIDVADGGTLKLAGPLVVRNGSIGSFIKKRGPGTLTIDGPLDFVVGSAGIGVDAGTVNLNANAGRTSLSVSGDTTAKARLVLGADQDPYFLSIGATATSAGTLDLNSGAGPGDFRSIRLFPASPTSLDTHKTSLNSLIKFGVAHPGQGIIDSGLAAHPNSAIGIANMGDHIFIRPTLIGDLNLDGAVTISDFVDLASNFGRTSAVTWQEGDLNYDGAITIADFIDIASNFGSSYSGEILPIAPADHLMLASFASTLGVDPSIISSSVPEPSALASITILAATLLRRRPRISHRAH